MLAKGFSAWIHVKFNIYVVVRAQISSDSDNGAVNGLNQRFLTDLGVLNHVEMNQFRCFLPHNSTKVLSNEPLVITIEPNNHN